MELKNLPFSICDLARLPAEEHAGVTGKALWRVMRQGDVRVRIVDYTPGYLADHWCDKGHVVFVLAGEFVTELEDGRTFSLSDGMCYVVADRAEAHRSFSRDGVTLLIVD